MTNKQNLINLKLIIEYDGKNYFGWQRQKSKPSIQETIEKSLQVLFPKEKINLAGAGRTDAGVHALNQVANFKVNKSSVEPKNLNKLRYSLNSILPKDIAVKRVSAVNDNFNSRYSARSRVYRYTLSTVKKGFSHDKCYQIKTKFDIDLAKEFCKLVEGVHSFKSLCKNSNDKHNFLCDVKYAKAARSRDNLISFEICASRFLHSMVRAIVGTMIKIASGKLSINKFQEKFKKGEKLKLQYVPSNALILVKVNY
ncbi:MAG: tRNA pseudouridine(38-40) synthase TruA [Chlorobi bacterium]|nr:tRNA pseudouridine(38-40) synthase TruA [Chlorobiota bacterium]MCI0715395.1 tRNA pseudouridine(38-40) synthase TruA [Chlorobiota bacterium]